MNPALLPALADLFIIGYGDGCCIPNPGPGGHAWCATMPDGSTVEYHRHDPDATNSTQEMKALLSFLEWVPPEMPAVIFLDSQFVVKGCNEWLAGWRKGDGKAVANADLWKQIDALLSARKVRVEWVKGHATSAGNNRADALADEAARNWGLADGLLRVIPQC